MMQRILTATLAFVLTLSSVSAFAQEPAPQAAETPPVEELVERLRRLPPEELARLRKALKRFRALPEKQRAELRERARAVGRDRLVDLRGRDVEQLRARQKKLDAEVDRIVELLGGESRFESWGPDGIRLVRHEALRRFQAFFRARVLQEIGRTMTFDEFEGLSPAERKTRLSGAMRKLEAQLYEALPEEEREEIEKLDRRARRKRSAALLLEFREAQYDAFARRFDQFFVVPLMTAEESERRKRIDGWRRRAAWHATRRVLKRELGLPRSTLELVRRLSPADKARVLRFYEDRREKDDPTALRAAVDEFIREVHGRASTRSPR